jgi:hypothetical protein
LQWLMTALGERLCSVHGCQRASGRARKLAVAAAAEPFVGHAGPSDTHSGPVASSSGSGL